MADRNAIIAIKVHMDAINALLKILDTEARTPIVEQEPACPKCGSPITAIPRCMGSTVQEYCCVSTSCDWRGELE